MTKMMKKLMVLIMVALMSVTAAFAKSLTGAEQFINWELTNVKSFSWNDETMKEWNDIYVPMLGEDYAKYILDGPFDVDSISERVGQELNDTEGLDIFNFKTTRRDNAKKMTVSFIEYEPNKFYMLLGQEIK
jgi:hypothetical protein